MKHLMKRSLALLCMLALLLSVLPAAFAAEGETEFVVLSTTDMHGRTWDRNVLNDTNMNNSMLNVATAVAKLRETYGDNVVLVDNGDTYQGTPVSTLQISQYTQGLTTDPNPMAIAMKYIGYDAANSGNHEFNYAWDTMADIYAYLESDVEGLKSLPAVCANLYYEDGSNVLTPYVIKNLKDSAGNDVKVAILCFVTPDCTRWDVPDNYPGMRFSHPDNPALSIRWEAEKWVKTIEEKEAPDFVIVAFHSGLGAAVSDEDLTYGVNTENQVYSMIAGTTGIDMVIAGHDHSESYSNKSYKNAEGKDVLVVNGGGNSLTTSVFTIAADGTISLKSSVNNKLSNYAADAGLKALIQPYADAANEYVSNTAGVAVGDWNTTTKFYLEQSDTMDLIGRAQMAQGSIHLAEKYDTEDKQAELYAATGLTDLGVDLSSTSVVVNGSYNVKAGNLSMKDIYRMYRYDNSLYLLPVTGAEIREILEFNAATHLSVSTASGTPVFGTTGDDFTNPIFYGIDFQYDMSREKYDRIVGLKFADGREVVDEEVYILAVNNYHLGNASGPFAEYGPEDCIWSQTDDMGGGFVQDLIAEFLTAETEAKGGVSPAPSNWEIVYTGEIVVGEATGKYILDLVEDPATLADGDTVAIFYNAGASLVNNVASGSKLQGTTEVTIGDKKIGTDDESGLFTLRIGEDGFLRFVDAEGKYMTSGATGNALTMDAAESEYSLWALEATDGGFYVHAVNAVYNGNANQYLEYYSGFTTYGLGAGGDKFLFNIYKLNEPAVECNHEETEIVGAKDPTCAEEGYTGDLCCAACGEVLEEGEAIPTTEHDEGELVGAKEPTCSEEGYTGDLCCTACGAVLEEGEAIPTTEHGDSVLVGAKDATCTAAGYTGDLCCSVCGEILEEGKRIAAPGHDYSKEEIVAPTCEEVGYTKKICANCDGFYRTDFIAPLGHDYVDGACSHCGQADPNAEEKSLYDTYSDLERNTWYEVGVEFALEQGLMVGIDEGEFAPDGCVTRAMLVTILYRLEGCPDVSNITNPYYDVPEDLWYTDAVVWANSKGIVNGTAVGIFEPDTAISREQIVTILYRYAKKPATEGNLGGFADADKVSAYAYEALCWAVEEGIINGIQGELQPQACATRAQIATILYRFLKK